MTPQLMTPELTAAQIRHFDTFGFVIRPRMLTPAETAEIEAAFEAVMAEDRAGESFRGDKRHSVIGCAERHPALRALIDDPRIVRPIEQVFGRSIMWWGSDGNYYVGDTAWHPDGTDLGLALRRIKVSVYLDPVDGDSGAIRFIPGSHRNPMHGDLEALQVDRVKQTIVEGRADRSALDGYRERGFDVDAQEPTFGVEHDALPCCVAASRPGDVVFFDQNLFHASFGGRSGRRMFTLCYCTVPEEQPARACMQRSYEGSHRAVRALSYGGAAPSGGGGGGGGVHHPAILRTDRPTLRRLTEPLVKLGWV